MPALEKQRDWRDWERAWQADPDNQNALQQSIQALRRAGEIVPRRMLDHLFEARKQFTLPFQATFGVLPRAGHLHYVEGRRTKDNHYFYSLPPRKRWWLHVEAESLDSFYKFSDDLRRIAIPELVFERVAFEKSALPIQNQFPSIHSLEFDHCTGLQSFEADPFKPFVNLSNLQFYQSQLPECPANDSLTQLEQLTFNDCPNLTDKLFERFLTSDRIQKIELKRQGQLSEKAFERLAKIKGLRSLSFLSNDGRPTVLEQIANLSQLEELILQECKFLTPVRLRAFKQLRKLRKLDLSSSYFMDDQQLKAISKLDSLEEIQLTHNDEFSSVGLSQLAALPRLSALKLVHCRGFGGEGLKAFEESESLKQLDLSACTQMTVDDFSQVKLPESLERLVLYGCYGVSNPVLATFNSLVHLRKLNLHSCHRITNKGLSYLKGLSELTHLEVSNSGRITDRGMKHILVFKKLRQLGLSSCQRLSDVGVAQLSCLEELRSLDLGACPNVTDTSFQSIGQLNQLEKLIVNYCGIDGSGLSSLGGLKTLSWLCMVGCSEIPIEKLRSLKKSLPDCHMTVPMTLFAQWGSP
ncbi:MAG: leucine-rich repeat protein [Planctomycetota bacterium]|nr:leucine-rich repeat protein [Planctomycetota bacterium]